jgi:hypothetical protein
MMPDLIERYVIEMYSPHSPRQKVRYAFRPERFYAAQWMFEELSQNDRGDIVVWCVEFEEAE